MLAECFAKLALISIGNHGSREVVRLDQGPWGLVALIPCQHPVYRIDLLLFLHLLTSPSSWLSIVFIVLTTYQDLKEVLVGDVGQLGAVELGNHELCESELASLST